MTRAELVEMTEAALIEALLDERFPGRWVHPPEPPPPSDMEIARRQYALQLAARIPYRPITEKRTA